MQPRLLGVAVGLAFAGMATVGPAMAAPVTYQYQGPNFGSASGIYSTSMSISGQLTFSSALAPNIDIFLTPGNHPGLQNFSFTDGINTITLANTTDFGTPGCYAWRAGESNKEGSHDITPVSGTLAGRADTPHTKCSTHPAKLLLMFMRETKTEAEMAKVLTFDEARRIAVNVAKPR